MISRVDVPRRVAEVLGRPARWAATADSIGDYDGREHTLDVFDAEAREQLALLRALRAERAELERAAGGPLIVIFHTKAETRRLYGDVLKERERTAR